MTGHQVFLPRSVIEATLRIPDSARSLGRAACLYLALVALASNRGIVIRTRKRLAETISASEPEIDRWLGRLAKVGLLTIEVPAPYLVMRLRFWSTKPVPEARNVEQTASESENTHREVSVSGSKQAAAAASSKTNGDGVQGEGVAVLAEARELLGDGDLGELAALLSQYPERIVRRALARVRATPERRIRKSKLALFRFLLAKFTDDAHGDPRTHHPHD